MLIEPDQTLEGWFWQAWLAMLQGGQFYDGKGSAYYTGTDVSYQKSNLTSNRPMSTIHENTFKFKIGWKQNINKQLKDWVW